MIDDVKRCGEGELQSRQQKGESVHRKTPSVTARGRIQNRRDHFSNPFCGAAAPPRSDILQPEHGGGFGAGVAGGNCVLFQIDAIRRYDGLQPVEPTSRRQFLVEALLQHLDRNECSGRRPGRA
jgi:hypothetical protein